MWKCEKGTVWEKTNCPSGKGKEKDIEEEQDLSMLHMYTYGDNIVKPTKH
jgi:hypothetical protein